MADFALVQAAIRTTTGTQDFTVSGFGTPKGAMVFVSGATVNGTAADHAILGIGATDGINTNSCCGHSKDNVTTTVCGRQGSTGNQIITVLNQDAGDLIIASFSAWITDGIRISVNTAPASGYLITVLLIGGSGVSNVYSATVQAPSTIDTGTTVTAPGFQPDVVITFDIGDSTAWTNSNETWNMLGIGFVTRSASNPHPQYTLAFIDVNNQNPSQTRGYLSSSRTLAIASSGERQVEIQDFTSSGFSAFTRNKNGSATTLGYVAIKLNGLSAKILSFNSPTSGGSQAITGVGFSPQLAIIAQSALTALDSYSTDTNSEVFAVGLATAAAQYSVGMASDDAVSPSNCESVTHNRPVFLRKDGSAFMDATLTSMDSDGLTLNYGTANGTARKWTGLFIGSPTSNVEDLMGQMAGM